MKFLIVQFSPTAYYLIRLRSNSTLFSNTLVLCISLNIRDQVSRSYKITVRMIVSYMVIFMFLDSGRGDKRL
jgi:hypothetical protein